jgi:type IV pilus assembly protein PilP
MMRAALCLALSALLAGCTPDRSDLLGWMDQVRAQTRPVQERISEPKQFEPFRYDRAGEVDPFARSRLAGLPPEGAAQAADSRSLQPDMRRARELLEGYPLDSIRMVGHLSNGRQSFALLQVDGIVHQVRVGNYAGQSHGVITRVTETEVRFRELVQDAAGDWVHRETTLALQEGG